MYNYTIEHVQEVTNGDELRLILDTGFDHSVTVKVWLNGVTTARAGSFDRTGNDLGKDAKAFTTNWFTRAPRPWNVQVSKEEHRGGESVYLVDVYDANGASLNEALVTAELGTQHGL